MAHQTSTVRRKARTIPILGAAALAAVTLGFAAPALADSSPAGPSYIECRSGIVTNDGVSMSSLVVARIQTPQLPDTPGECSVR